MSSPRKPRSRRSTRAHDDDDDDTWDDGSMPAPVSDHAWSVLGWILTLFESDEANIERTGQVRYSPLLLKQIPPSRAHNSPRWEVEMPLDVAFHALEQDGEAQRSLGVRLLALLINLTSTTLLDFPMFLNSVSNRVSSLSIDAISYLFASLPATQAVAQFKVMLCRHALGGPQATSGRPRPQPQARARAQPRRRTRTTDAAAVDVGASMDLDGLPSTSLHSPPSAPESAAGSGGAPSVARKHPAIPASDILALLARPSKTDVVRTLELKIELVYSYALLQMQAGENDRDGAWRDALRDGTLKRAIEDVFDAVHAAGLTDAQSKERVRAQKDVLLAIMSTW